jgi:uncharacterized Zn-finger protein
MQVESARVWPSSMSPALHHESDQYIPSPELSPLFPSDMLTDRTRYGSVPRIYDENHGRGHQPYPRVNVAPSPSTNSNDFSFQPGGPHSTQHHPSSPFVSDSSVLDGRKSPKQESYYAPNAAELYSHAQIISSPPSPGAESSSGANNYASSGGVPRLPPILQVERQQVTTSATQMASASRRRNEAHFVCPVPGCGSTFTRRFNLRGHLRSHTEERPYICEWPGCQKGFARQHDCKRHQALHTTRPQSNICQSCKKTFSRLDALNRHLRSEGGAECRQALENHAPSQAPSKDEDLD